MKASDLFWIQEDDCEHGYLSKYEESSDRYVSRPATDADLTAENVADFLDQHAEDRNRHDFVGCHQGLMSLLTFHLKPVKVREIMLAVLEAGGLDRLEK